MVAISSTEFISHLKVTCPTLLLDSNKAIANIDMMAAKARCSGVQFRPHFKTHQSAVIGEWFRERGVTGITVSSMAMAEYFANHGWEDIIVAINVNPMKIARINALASRIKLQLVVDHQEALDSLESQLTQDIGIFIKIDTAYHRTGVVWTDREKLFDLANQLLKSQHMQFRGILTHAGHSYAADSIDQIKSIYHQTVERTNAVKQLFMTAGFLQCDISVGDTPTCSVVEQFEGVDEIRPGNFVFYDLVQHSLNVCKPDQIAVVIACPVIGIYPTRQEVVVHGGAVHFSKDVLKTNINKTIYGILANWENHHWSGLNQHIYVEKLSQEHGIVHMPSPEINDIHIGDLLLFYPVHSCLTANLFPHYLTIDGLSISHFQSNG
ncbi:alanine racemase [candidate division KSB1 bacterium]|nr:alanine racemase [candidate division KSB1 bacterium]